MLKNLRLAYNAFSFRSVYDMVRKVSYKKGVEIIGSVKSTNYIYLVPLLTAITGIIVLNEKLTFKMIIGGTLILLGLYIAQRKPKLA